MTKEEALLHYKVSMAIFKNWLKTGAITESDLLEISKALAKKYGLSLFSIFLENDLLCKENRANIR